MKSFSLVFVAAVLLAGQTGCDAKAQVEIAWTVKLRDPREYAGLATGLAFMHGLPQPSTAQTNADLVAIGEPAGDGAGAGTGAVHIYELDGEEEPTFVETLFAADGESHDLFGETLSASNELIVVGAPGVGTTGAAYVYGWDGSSWLEQAKLIPDDAADYDGFGSVAATDGVSVVVSSPFDDDGGSNSGSVYVFEWTGNDWEQQAKLVASNSRDTDTFGSSVLVNGDTIIVGAPAADGPADYSGVVYVFERDGEGWVEQPTIAPPQLSYSAGFGLALFLQDDQLLVGAPWDDGTGAVYFFNRDGDRWEQTDRVVASDGQEDDRFGSSFVLAGNRLIVGAPGAEGVVEGCGAAHLFFNDGEAWSEEAKFYPDDGDTDDNFGATMVGRGDLAIVGAPFQTVSGVFRAGAAFGCLIPSEPSPEAVRFVRNLEEVRAIQRVMRLVSTLAR